MQVLVDLTSQMAAPFNPVIVQVDRAPVSPNGFAINGKYLLSTLPGLDFPIDDASYILNAGVCDGGDVSSQSFAHLLASYPMFEHIYFNPLLTTDHVDELEFDPLVMFKDYEAPYDPPNAPAYWPSRFQSGRQSGGGLADGQMPTHTAVLALNTSFTTIDPTLNRPGVMMSKEIDISAFTGPGGTDEFAIFWHIYGFSISDDVATDMNGGLNAPAVRTYFETSQEPTDFTVYLSPDNGVHWCPAGLLEPIAFWNKTTKFRVAFVNRSARSKVYVASFAVLF